MFVYILENSKGSIYVGLTVNLARRIKQHRSGKTISTASRGCLDWKIKHFYIVKKYSDASRLEWYLKGRFFKYGYTVPIWVKQFPVWSEKLAKFVEGYRDITETELLKDVMQIAGKYPITKFLGSPFYDPIIRNNNVN